MPTITTTRHKAQLGLSLVELMVAMTLGLLLMAGVGFLYLQGTRSHSQDDRYARMQEHARYALHILADDLKMADFWGTMLASDGITNGLAVGTDCGIGLGAGTNAVLYNNASPATTLINDLAGCSALTGTIAAGADVLAIKRVSGTPLTAGQVDGLVYLRTNSTLGQFVNDAATNPPPPGFSDWQYLPRLYYIQGGAGATPALCRLELTGFAFAAPAGGCVAQGIEQFHIQFGIDTDLDGLANQYISNVTLAQADAAVSARIYVLVRSEEVDREYTNAKAYVLGDRNIAAFNDNFYRRVFETTVSFRNTSSIIVLNN